MKVLESNTMAYRLNGNVISEASLDVAINNAHAILNKNDEIAPPFELWEEEEVKVDGDTLLSYYARTDTGKQIRISFSLTEKIAKVMLLSGEDEYYIDDRLLCSVTSAKKYLTEEWL